MDWHALQWYENSLLNQTVIKDRVGILEEQSGIERHIICVYRNTGFHTDVIVPLTLGLKYSAFSKI